MESFFNEIAGINSRPEALVKKHPSRRFTYEYIYNFIFSASTEGLMLFDKIEGYVLQGCIFIKALFHH